jgi:hypothetical protein
MFYSSTFVSVMTIYLKSMVAFLDQRSNEKLEGDVILNFLSVFEIFADTTPFAALDMLNKDNAAMGRSLLESIASVATSFTMTNVASSAKDSFGIFQLKIATSCLNTLLLLWNYVRDPSNGNAQWNAFKRLLENDVSMLRSLASCVLGDTQSQTLCSGEQNIYVCRCSNAFLIFVSKACKRHPSSCDVLHFVDMHLTSIAVFLSLFEQ